jgi:hypothetical protein
MGVVNDAAPTVRIGKRENTQNAVVYTSASSPSALTGMFRITASGRIHDFELTMTQASGTAWEHVQGLDVAAPVMAGMK